MRFKMNGGLDRGDTEARAPEEPMADARTPAAGPASPAGTPETPPAPEITQTFGTISGSAVETTSVQTARFAGQEVPQAATPVAYDGDDGEPAPAAPARRGPIALSVLGGLLVGFLLGLAAHHLIF